MMLGLGLSLSASQRASSFDPSKLTNVAHWYRADQGITLNAGNVAQWNDLVGTAHLVQATGANQPAYNATDAGYGNQPTVQSTAVGKRMIAAAIASSQPLSIWVVGDCQTDNAVLFSAGTSAASPPKISRVAGNVTAGANTNIASGVGYATKHAVLFTANGAASFLGVDNWLTGGVSGSAGANGGTTISIFAFSDGTIGSAGTIAELIVQAGVPTAAEKTNMAAYFARYGITVT
jgi:hypothetical protein